LSAGGDLSVADLLSAGHEALAEGEWELAQARFAAALEHYESADALEAFAKATSLSRPGGPSPARRACRSPRLASVISRAGGRPEWTVRVRWVTGFGSEHWHAARQSAMMGVQTRWPASGLASLNAVDRLSRDWLPRGRVARRTRGLLLGGVWLRCVTWRQAHELDEKLARGTDPITSDELSLRAGQLASARSRRKFACVLRGAVALADAPFDPFRMGRPVIRRAQIQENRRLLLELADRLGAGGILGVRGLAITSLLVRDGVSPLYSKAARSSLKASAGHALVALN
jgi:hypothetical protein